MTLGEGLNQRALRRSRFGPQRSRLLRGGQCPLLAIGVGRVVVVPTLGQRDTPEAHGALGIDARGLPECLLRLVVVERVDQPQALIEPALGVRRRRRDPIRIASERIVEDGTTIGGTPSVSSVRLALHGVLSLRRAAGQCEK